MPAEKCIEELEADAQGAFALHHALFIALGYTGLDAADEGLLGDRLREVLHALLWKGLIEQRVGAGDSGIYAFASQAPELCIKKQRKKV